MGLASQQKKLSKFFCPFGQIFGVELRQFQLDVCLGNGSARFFTPPELGQKVTALFSQSLSQARPVVQPWALSWHGGERGWGR